MHLRTRALLPLLVSFGARALSAQCEPQWLPGEGRLVPDGTVNAQVLWDPDGAGPLPLALAIGGSFAAGNTNAANVATYDGTQWTVLGGLTGTVTAMAVFNGQLHAATSTSITTPFPITTYAVHAWNGTGWQSLGASFGPVYAMALHGSQLVVGGAFNAVGGVSANNVAAWNGTTWSPLGAGVTGTVRTMFPFFSSLYVGGSITGAGGAPAGNLASWNGTAWAAGPTFNGEVRALAVRNAIVVGQSYLFVGGAFSSFTNGGSPVAAPRLARFEPNANTWIGLTSGSTGTRCTALLVRSVNLNGYEVAAGFEDANNTDRVWRLASGAWSSLGSLSDPAGNTWPAALSYYGSRYTAGLVNSSQAVRSYDGSSWGPVNGHGILGIVSAVEPTANGTVIGGTFATISGVTMNNIARGAPGAWTPLGSGVQGGLGVFTLEAAANGDVFAAGQFTTAGGAPANNIARWNGTAWAPLGTGMNGAVYALLLQPNGDLVAGGDFTVAGGVAATRIARWNGATWAPLGTGVDARLGALARLDNGDIVAAGNFQTAGGVACSRIARWNGASWSPLGSGCNGSVFTLAVAPDGALFAGGVFTVAGGVTTRVARWQNGVWSSTISLGITTQDVYSLIAHPNGDVFVGGEEFAFSLGPFGGWRSCVVRLTNGGSGLSSMSVPGDAVLAGAVAPDGDIVIGGLFETASSVVSTHFARLDAPCPATATPYGTACSGLTAPLVLAALEAPWVGASWRLRASAFGPTAFALRCIGFTQINVPLPPLLPGALPGCSAFTLPDYSEVHLPVAGTVTVTTPAPFDPALIGVQLNEQMIQFESAPGGGLAISSSNAMQLVVGDY